MFFEKYVPCISKKLARMRNTQRAMKLYDEMDVYYVGVYGLLPFCV